MGNDRTGGAIFRNLFTAFLNESREYLPGERSLERGAELYKQAAENWTGIAGLITKAGDTGR